MSSIQDNMLRQSKETKELLRFYTDRDDTTTFCVGYVTALNDKCIVFADFGLKGEFTGYRIVHQNNIVSLARGGVYLRELARHMIHAEIQPCPFDDKVTEQSALEHLQEMSCAVTIRTHNLGKIKGFIKAVDDTYVLISSYSLTVEYETDEMFKIDEIISTGFGGENEFLLDNLSERLDL
jgi:hypothetical protein